MNQDIQKLFIDLLLKMQVNINDPKIEQYLNMMEDFDYQCVKEVLDLWIKKHKSKQIPSINELSKLLIKHKKENEFVDKCNKCKHGENILVFRYRCKHPDKKKLKIRHFECQHEVFFEWPDNFSINWLKYCNGFKELF